MKVSKKIKIEMLKDIVALHCIGTYFEFGILNKYSSKYLQDKALNSDEEIQRGFPSSNFRLP